MKAPFMLYENISNGVYHVWMKSIWAILGLLIDVVFPKDQRHSNAVNNVEELHRLTNIKETKQGILYLLNYSSPLVKDTLVAFKTWGDLILAKELGIILNESLIEEIAEMKTFSSIPIVITCIPISKTKRRERGFNQCELIVDEMKKQSADKELVFNTKCLSIFHETEDQVGKSRSERIKNLNGAFVADEKLVRDHNIFVIDDVTTTGATLLEAKRALIKAGARKVVMIALAH